MSEQPQEDIKITLLDQLDAPVAPEPVDDKALDNIQVSEDQHQLRRIAKELPPDDTVVMLGERDGRLEQVVIDERIIKEMSQHLTSNMAVELGGALIGHYCEDPRTKQQFTQITKFVADEHGRGTVGTFTMTPDSFSAFHRIIDSSPDGEVMVGWVHAHPFDYPPAPSGRDEFIMRHFFPNPEQLTLILGRGGSFDKKYALWRWQDIKPVLQKGFGVISKDPASVRNQYRYFDTGATRETQEKVRSLQESWFRRSFKGILSLLGVKLGKSTADKLDHVLAITPDDLVGDVAEMVTITKDELDLEKKLDALEVAIASGQPIDKAVFDSITIVADHPQPESDIHITLEDLAAK